MKFWVSAILFVVVAVLIQHQNESPREITPDLVIEEAEDIEQVSVGQDSVLRVKAVEKALKTFVEQGNFDKDHSSTLYLEDVSGNNANVQIDYGFILNTTERHLQLIQHQKQKSVARLYEYRESELKPIAELSWNPEIEEFFLLDVNGDAYKDALTNEGSFYDVRIFQADSSSFSSTIKLRNPCFAPSEKIVRLFEPLGSDTLYYKMKWESGSLVPVEFIYPHPENTFWKLKTTERKDSLVPDEAVTLWYLPREYRAVAACVEASVQ